MRRVSGPLAGYVVLAVLALPGLAASAPEALPALELAPPAEPVETAPAPDQPAQTAPPEAPPAATPPPPAQAPVPAVAAAEPAPERESRKRRDEVTVAASGTVVISDFEFAPATISINAGDTVTWRNDGPTPHSATASDGSFDTGIMRKGASGSHTFDSAGTFAYICTPHPNMKGTVQVAAAAGGDDGTPNDDGTAGSDDASTDTGSTADGDTTDDGPQLAATGADTWFLALVGALALGLGVLLRRSAASKPAG